MRCVLEVAGRRNKVAGHVFISYVREDSDQVDQLQSTLESAGIPVWRDTARLWPGQDWRRKIRRAITDDALVFIACFSNASLARDKSYQNEELNLAIEQSRLRNPEDPWLIPIRFDECIIPDLEIGGGRALTSIQRADLFGDHSDDNAARLVEAITNILGTRPEEEIPQESDGWDASSSDIGSISGERDGAASSIRIASRSTRIRFLAIVATAIAVTLGILIGRNLTATSATKDTSSPPASTAGKLSRAPVSFTVNVLPSAVLNPATGPDATRQVVTAINYEIAVRHLQKQGIGAVLVFAGAPASEAGPAAYKLELARAAALSVEHYLIDHSPAFAHAAGQALAAFDLTGFEFQIYFSDEAEGSSAAETTVTENGLVTNVGPDLGSAGVEFAFQPDSGKPQMFKLETNIPWLAASGQLHNNGLPSCIVPMSHQARRLAVILVEVKLAGFVPAKTVLVSVECKS